MTAEELYAKFAAQFPKVQKASVEVKGSPAYATLRLNSPAELEPVIEWLKGLGFTYLDIVTATDYKGPIDVKGFVMDPNPNAFLPEGATPQIEAPTATPNYPYREAFELEYCLTYLEEKIKVFLKLDVPRDGGKVPSLVKHFPAADWQERETLDLYGIGFEGHPNPTKILTPDFIKGYPLRKDYVHTPDQFD
ncbi:MAG: NADH-quinone oxidoreductase subunit C [Elusimicrobia bacterium]|nr:NADH-quinone oxidoreductase subunit C [Elusimicrobiota bacterium]